MTPSLTEKTIRSSFLDLLVRNLSLCYLRLKKPTDRMMRLSVRASRDMQTSVEVRVLIFLFTAITMQLLAKPNKAINTVRERLNSLAA